MKLSKSSWLIRLAYYGDEMPDRTDLCRLFWRLTLTPLRLLFYGFILLLYFMAVGVEKIQERLPEKQAKVKIRQSLGHRWHKSIIRQRILDFKHKTCTLVEFE